MYNKYHLRGELSTAGDEKKESTHQMRQTRQASLRRWQLHPAFTQAWLN